jgi:hypothetical protein
MAMTAVTSANDAEHIQEQMAHMRGDLYDDVHGIVENARIITDWQCCVRNYPWISLGAAFVFGYLAVPARLEVIRPDIKTLLRLAKKNRLVVQPRPEGTPRRSLAAAVLSLVAKTAVQGALSYLEKRDKIKETAP